MHALCQDHMEFVFAVLLHYHTCGTFTRRLQLLQDLRGQSDCVASWYNPCLKSDTEFCYILSHMCIHPCIFLHVGKKQLLQEKCRVKIMNKFFPSTLSKMKDEESKTKPALGRTEHELLWSCLGGNLAEETFSHLCCERIREVWYQRLYIEIAKS